MGSKKYNALKGVQNMNKMLMTESIGFGIAGKITTGIDNPVASQAFATGSSLAGTSSLVYGAGNVLGSLGSLNPNKKYKRRR